MIKNSQIKQSKIGGVVFDDYDLGTAVKRIQEKIEEGEVFFVLPFNMRHFVRLKNDDKILKRAVNSAEYIFADGMPIVWVSRLAGAPLPSRVTGCDLGKAIIRNSNSLKVLLLATNDQRVEVGEKAAEKFVQQGLNVKGVTQSYETTLKKKIPKKVVSLIKNWQPDIVMIGLGGQEQEEWILQNQKKYQIPFCMGVGGSIDIWAGNRRRAPKWMQLAGLEWSYQVVKSPKKIKRYLKQFPVLAWLILNSLKRRI